MVRMSAHSWRVHTQCPPFERSLVVAYFSPLLDRKGINECHGSHFFGFGVSMHILKCSCVRFSAQKVFLFELFRHILQVILVYLHQRFVFLYEDDLRSFAEIYFRQGVLRRRVENVFILPGPKYVD